MKTRMKSADDIWAQAIRLVSEQAKRDYANKTFGKGLTRIERIKNIAIRYSNNIGKHFGVNNNENFVIKVERKIYMK